MGQTPAIEPHGIVLAHREHLRARKLSEGHIRRRVNDLQRLQKWLDKPLLEATPEDLRRWQADIASRRSTVRSLYTELSQIRAFYRWAVHDEHLIKDPTIRGFTMPRLPRLLPRPMSEEDIDVAISCAPARIKPWLVLAAYAGLRCVEISRLQGSDVVLAQGQSLLILRGKGGHDRVVPASTRVVDALREHGLPTDGGPVFRRNDGKPGAVTPHMVSKIGNEYLHGLGISDTMHQLRHRFGTVLYQTTGDLRLVQDIMGHADPSTTAGYAAFDVSKAAGALERVGRV